MTISSKRSTQTRPQISMHRNQNGNISLGSSIVNDLLNKWKDKLSKPHNKTRQFRFLREHTTNLQLSPYRQPTQSELNQPIEEQANPRVLDPPHQQPQEEELPVAPVVPPELPEETPLTMTTRSGWAIRPTARYQQSLAQREQGIVAWEILVEKQFPQ